MLLELTIKDFAIIDHLNLRLNRQFNVFTGETGAGKSIIIDAVNALLGGKIGVEVVRAGSERATVEGVFSIGALPPIAMVGSHSKLRWKWRATEQARSLRCWQRLTYSKLRRAM